MLNVKKKLRVIIEEFDFDLKYALFNGPDTMRLPTCSILFHYHLNYHFQILRLELRKAVEKADHGYCEKLRRLTEDCLNFLPEQKSQATASY